MENNNKQENTTKGQPNTDDHKQQKFTIVLDKLQPEVTPD